MPIVVAVLLIIIVLAVKSLWEYSPLLFVFLALAPVFLIWWSIDSKRKAAASAKKALDELQSQFTSRVDFHINTLYRKFKQSVYQDDYGRYVVDKWNSEKEYFLDNVVKNELPGSCSSLSRVWMMGVIDSKITEFSLKTTDNNINESLENVSPIDFEHHCADILRSAGWNARVTQASGDQGIDIVAELDGVRAVFQCKKYSAPVGNAAVQEIIAGKVFEQADVAAVVTNSTYTKSARALAQSSGVHLLHVSDLMEFRGKIGLSI
jgi:restriction system protein